MKSFIVAFALFAIAAADVSHLHLNNEYLPPVQSAPGGVGGSAAIHTAYAQQSEEIPQVIGANTYTPTHLIDLPVAPAQQAHEEISVQEPQAPTIVYGDVPTHQAVVQEAEVEQVAGAPGADFGAGAPGAGFGAGAPGAPAFQFDALTQPELLLNQEVSNGIDTQYAANGGYVY